MESIKKDDFINNLEELLDQIEEPLRVVNEDGEDLVMLPFDMYLDMIRVADPEEYEKIKKMQNDGLL